jgi:hypothetical protein
MGKVIAWRPKAPAPTTARATDLWTMEKEQWQVHCAVEQRGALGWAIRVRINRHWFFWCEFETYEQAIEAAEIKYRELSSGGWMPASVSPTVPAVHS